MIKRIKDKWLKALRSGEYEQGSDQLVDNNNCFCCLGVLTDLYLREKGKGWEIATDDEYSNNITNWCPANTSESNYLTPEIMKWAGFNNHDPRLRTKPDGYPRSRVKIAVLNDDHRYTFNQLANLIEKQF